MLRRSRRPMLLGPAFVAAIAYVDPGNVAANITAGARYGFLLVWVLVAACLIAMLIQYQSAKLGVVTGRSLPGLLGERLPRAGRIAYWAQAEIVAAATDVAEIIGGAIALQLLFGLPLVVGGVVVGAVSMVMLSVQTRRGQRAFETMVGALLAVIVIGFLCGLVIDPPSATAVLGGLIPRLQGADSVLLAASMFGATVMPHAIYLHSTLVIDRHGHDNGPARVRTLIRATRWDVLVALSIAGAVNVALLVMAAHDLRGRAGTDTIDGAHTAVSDTLGTAVGVMFAVGLLASSLASTAVGSYAGSSIMAGLLRIRVPILLRRMVVLIPALVVLGAGVDPTWALIMSQVILSFGIPFAIIPLGWFSASRELLGAYADPIPVRVITVAATAVIIALNVALIVLVVLG